MVVVDTNILAYLLIAGDRTREAQALYGRDANWQSEAFLLVEFSNILATYQRLGELDPDQVEGLMNDAETRLPGLIHLPHLTALRIAKKTEYPPTTPALLLRQRNWGQNW